MTAATANNLLLLPFCKRGGYWITPYAVHAARRIGMRSEVDKAVSLAPIRELIANAGDGQYLRQLLEQLFKAEQQSGLRAKIRARQHPWVYARNRLARACGWAEWKV